MIRISIDDREVRLGLTDFAKRQMPFATAQALTATARRVAEAEARALPEVFSNPTPFTMRAFGVAPARKSSLRARVFAKDAQAAYLAPYEGGGLQVLGSKKAILTPRDIAVNRYGNIPRNKIASLKGRPGIFIGEVRFKNGTTISGVWQRSLPGKQAKGPRKGSRRGGKGAVADRSAAQKATLKLLVQFTHPAEVTHHMGYATRAAAVVKAVYPLEFEKAFDQAMKTARA